MNCLDKYSSTLSVSYTLKTGDGRWPVGRFMTRFCLNTVMDCVVIIL